MTKRQQAPMQYPKKAVLTEALETIADAALPVFAFAREGESATKKYVPLEIVQALRQTAKDALGWRAES